MSERMSYGYVYMEYNDTFNIKKGLKYPYECIEFYERTYMYLNPILSDYFHRQN